MESVTARAPGRVNLIGEHTDYNGGFVLPCAIRFETTVRAQVNDGRTIEAESSFGSVAFALNALRSERAPEGRWSDYVAGVVLELRERGVDVPGAAMRIESTLPAGAGLSSSAALEVSSALALLALAGARLQRREVAELAQQAEIRYAGVNCGIMDQFTVLHGRRGSLLLLDTQSLEHRYVPLPANAAIVICNTMVRHQLAAGEYNARRLECRRSVDLLRARYPQIASLRDVTHAQLLAERDRMPAVLLRRARHVVTENERVVEAASALELGDVRRCGELMIASHESLRTDFEVSCGELDLMVRIACANGAYGARMTGGGFGGCTVNLVERDRVRAFAEETIVRYRNETGITPEIYDGTPADGASVSSDG